MTTEFRPETISYLKKTTIGYRKKHGQYFTPESVRNKLLDKLPVINRAHILDPACGTGEFLLSAKERYPDALLTGWEVDSSLCGVAQKVIPEAEILPTDSLNSRQSQRYDLVIGNPPYYEFKPTVELKRRYRDVIHGRPNIFAMFVKLGLDILKPDGHLAFVIPPSMNNGAYFSKLRAYITAHADIRYLEILNSPRLFDQAQQTVMLFILRKRNNSGSYLFRQNGITLFCEKPALLKKAFRGKTTFHQLGFTVATGKIVWNKTKERLTDNKQKGHLFIWSHNIKNGRIVLGAKPGKPQYIITGNPDTGPAIVVNRITGTTGLTSLRAAVIPKGQTFLAENHVNVITPPTSIPDRKLKEYAMQLMSEETAAVLKQITGNTQISKTELAHLLPIHP